MEYMTPTDGTKVNITPNKILCCQCGTLIEPNVTNMCLGCIRSQVDITADIPKQVTLHFCRKCERYLEPPSEWISCTLESRELLSLCLHRLKGLNRVKLVDAGFIWTEPHSKRMKVKITIQGEVPGGAILQQVFAVEYTVANQTCNDCHRSEAQDYWSAVVQVRQRAENKGTFYYLEQLMLKHKAHENTTSIKPMHGGLDFYYSTEQHARKMIDFLMALLPCRREQSNRLISQDIQNNTCNNKLTFSVEIVPISKDSVVCLSKKLASKLGGINQLCIVTRVTRNIHLIDPSSAQVAEVSSDVYWRDAFNAIFNPKSLIEFIIMDVELIMDKDRKYFPGQGTISKKHVLADIWVVKESDLGMTDAVTIHTRTHLGHLLKPGDSALGYFLTDNNVNDVNFDKIPLDKVPDVILVKKHYPDKKRKRIWHLKHIFNSESNDERDYNNFLEDIEEGGMEYRQNINIYKNASMPIDLDEVDIDAPPQVSLQEMLEDLDLGNDVEPDVDMD